MKISFIGCGNIAHVHIKYLKKNKLTVSSVCDASITRAEEFADKYGIKYFFADIEEMLREQTPDVVHLLTPPHTHFNLIKRLLNSDCHVFAEKPLCQTLQEYHILSKLADDKTLILSVDHTRVYSPMVKKAREYVLSGRYGKLIRIEYDYDDPSVIKTDKVLNGFKWARGVPSWFSLIRGGILADLLPHPLSVLLTFDDQLKVSYVYSNTLADNLPVNITALLSSQDLHALIKLSLLSKPLKNLIHIYCEQGTIKIDLRNMYDVYLPDRQMPNIVSRVVNFFSETFQKIIGFTVSVVKLVLGIQNPYDGMEFVIGDFYERIIQKDNSVAPFINARKVMALTEKILKISSPAWNGEEIDPMEIFSDRTEKEADVLVFGGSGFIGRTLVEKLIKQGKRVRVFCRSIEAAHNLPIEVSLAFGDVKKINGLKNALPGIKEVYYCAAAMAGDWAEFYESTVMGTQNLLQALKGSEVEKLLYVSSLGIINYNILKDGDIINEDSLVDDYAIARGAYTRSKKEAEDLVTKFAHEWKKINTTIFRPGLVYGYGSNNNIQNAGVLIGNFLFVFGLGRRYLGLSYVENLAESMIKAFKTDLNSGQIIHVVETEQPTVKEVIRYHNTYSDNRVFPVYIPIFVWKTVFFVVDIFLTIKYRKKSTYGYRFASNSKRLIYQNEILIKLLKWQPSNTIIESFKKTYNRS